MDTTAELLSTAHVVYARAASNPSTVTRPPAYKAAGISLAIASGVFIGISFVLKKVGLLKANVKYNEEAGEGYGYLKNAYWWTGMTLMIIGEICNFVAYAFVDAILVTPLGSLSVVITTILSAIFLKERLSFVGKIGCFVCIVGSVVIVMNAPDQSSVATIQEMKHFVIAPGFLSYAGVIVIASAFIALWAGPRYGKQSMLVYLSVCSLIGGLSVVATQGLGAAIVAQAGGTPQFNQWFLYLLLVFVVATLVTEIIYLNKALNIFNAALVTPTYYVFFTSSTIVTSAILFRGFRAPPKSIATVVMGFLQICAGVILLQLSKSAKDVPDAAVFSGNLDQVRTVAEQEQPESEPKADAIRGTAAIIRRLSTSRQKLEVAEAKRIHEERLKDQMEPIGENEQYEWDGLRRRKTTLREPAEGLHRRKTLHPPLGLTHFPDETGPEEHRTSHEAGTEDGSFLDNVRRRAHSVIHRKHPAAGTPDHHNSPHPNDLNDTSYKGHSTIATEEPMEMSHVYGLPPGLQRDGMDGAGDSSRISPGLHGVPLMWADEVSQERSQSRVSLAPEPPPHTAKRQFSFHNVFHRHKNDSSVDTSDSHRPSSRVGLGSRQSNKDQSMPGSKNATEEERLGLVKGDSSAMLPLPDYTSDDDDWQIEGRATKPSASAALPIREEKELEDYEEQRERWDYGRTSPELRNVMPVSKRRDDDSESDQEMRNVKDWEGRGGGPSAGGAFI
ncbi:MAG: hypothetical protein M1830_001141 [Pleopsidium flavum]|nr:MAG: hypothetical protein M1830_001141 [Pleopsidium flavum]